MTKPAIDKPQLHWSMLNMIWYCGEQFRRRYPMGEKIKPGIALFIGGNCHEVNAKNMTRKVAMGQLMEREELQDLARDTANRRWELDEIVLTPEERVLGLKKVKGRAIDMTIALTHAYHRKLAPEINPDPTPRLDAEGNLIGYKGIERPWVVKCENYPYDLAGTTDITDLEIFDNEGQTEILVDTIIRDTKTAKASPGQDKVDGHDQFTCYGLAHWVIEGKAPARYAYDALIKNKKPSVITKWTTRDRADFAVFMNRFENACAMIEKEAFVPIGRDNWRCSEMFCGFFHTCKFAKGRLSMSVL